MASKITKYQLKDIDIPAGQLIGAVIKVNPTAVTPANYGATAAVSGMVLHAPRHAVGISMSITGVRTTGTLTAQWSLNGVVQSESALIDGTDTQYSHTEFTTPVALSAGDVVSMNTSSVGFAPSNVNATLALSFSL